MSYHCTVINQHIDGNVRYLIDGNVNQDIDGADVVDVKWDIDVVATVATVATIFVQNGYRPHC